MGDNDGGMLLIGTKGKLMAGMWGKEPTLLPTSKMKEAEPEAELPFVKNGPDGHQAQWVRACKEGYGAYTSSPFSVAGPLTETVIMGNLAVRSHNHREAKADGEGHVFPGRKELLWDGKNMKVTNERQTLMAGMWGKEPTLLPTSKMKEAELPEAELPFVKNGPDGHQAQWVRACKEGYGAYTSSPFSVAGPLTETVIMGNLAVRSHNHREAKADGEGHVFPGRKELLWDGKNMKVTNFDEANAFVNIAGW